MTAALLAAAASTNTSPGWLLPVGATAAFGAILVATLVFALPTGRTRLEDAGAGSRGKERMGLLRSLSDRAAKLTGETLEGSKKRRVASLLMRLESAGLPVRSGEAILALGAVAFGLLVVGVIAGGPLVGLALVGLAVVLSHFWLNRRISARRKAFGKQLPDMLRLLASNLRAGHAVNIALESVSEELRSPTKEELQRVLSENRLGREMTESMQAMADRLASDDFQWVVQAIEVNRQVGGDLAEVLDNVLETISERERLRGVVRSLSADGRLSAVILSLMPFGVVAFVLVSNPGYFDNFVASGGGRIAIAAGFGLMAIGTMWAKAITKVRF